MLKLGDQDWIPIQINPHHHHHHLPHISHLQITLISLSLLTNMSHRRKSSIAKTPQLPPRYSTRLYNVTNLSATKSWRRTTSRCNISEHLPWLQLHHVEHTSDYESTYANAYPHGTVVDVSTSRILPSTNAKIPSKFALIISSHNDDASCHSFVIPLQLTGIASPALVAYRFNQRGPWNGYQHTLTVSKYECSTIDPFDKKCMQFTGLVKLGEVYFAPSLQGALVVMQEIDGFLTISAISSSRAVPSVSCRSFKEYLFEWNGEIFVVFLIHRKSVTVVDEVEVFRLRFPDLKWVKVEGLQGMALFLNQPYVVEVVNSAENGRCRGDCVYFTQGSDKGWWIYDMERGCILPAY